MIFLSNPLFNFSSPQVWKKAQIKLKKTTFWKRKALKLISLMDIKNVLDILLFKAMSPINGIGANLACLKKSIIVLAMKS